MTQVTVNLTDSFEDWRVKTNTLGTNQGDLATLTTTATNSMVAAMNEIHAQSGLGNLVEDTTPQLGGNLDVLARTIITSTTNGNIAITPNGTGSIILDGLTHPQADGTNGQVLSTNGAGVLSFTTISSDPTMGGDLSGNASTAQLVANCVTATELAGDAVTGAQIADDAINSEHIAADSIDAEHYAAGSVDQTAIGDSQVATAKIVNSAVTVDKLGANAVTDAKVADNALSGNKIHGGTISNFASTGIDDNADALAITIDSAEKVGIVTTTPGSYEAEASQLVVGTTSGNNGITIASGTANTGNIYFADGTTGNSKYRGSISFSHSTEDMSWTTGANIRMTLDNTGNLGINNTSPSEKLYVSGNIYATGNITAYSDKRIKKNVKELNNALDAVENIRGVSYTRTDTNDNGIGVIAQEVEALFPDLIVEDNEGMKSVNYNGLIGVLFSAVKELSAEVKKLKKKNE